MKTIEMVEKAKMVREEKRERLAKIVSAIKKDKKAGRRLFFVCDDVKANHDYYRTERAARKAVRQRPEEHADYYDDGSLKSVKTVYPLEVEEIKLGHILGYLRRKNPVNPFMELYHSYSDYPYEWLQEIEDLFRANRDDFHAEGERTELLFEEEQKA